MSLISYFIVEGLSLLTGAPCETLALQKNPFDVEPDHELIWGQLISSRQAGHVMGASCGGGQMQCDDKAFDHFGLSPRHAYSLLDVRPHGKTRLVRLRNPWGKFSWKGAWCDSSPQMQEGKNKEVLRANRAHEGVFWMEYKDFAQWFDSVDICRVNHDWSVAKLNGVLPNVACVRQQMGVLTVTETAEIVITLFQRESRKTNMAKCLDLSVVVARCKDKTFTPLALIANSKRQMKSFVTCSHVFQPGMYIVVPMAFNHYKSEPITISEKDLKSMPTFNMTFHSVVPVKVYREYIQDYTLADSLWLLIKSNGVFNQGRSLTFCISYYQFQQCEF